MVLFVNDDIKKPESSLDRKSSDDSHVSQYPRESSASMNVGNSLMIAPKWNAIYEIDDAKSKPPWSISVPGSRGTDQKRATIVGSPRPMFNGFPT